MFAPINNNDYEMIYLDKIYRFLNKLKISLIIIIILYSVYLYYMLKTRCCYLF